MKASTYKAAPIESYLIAGYQQLPDSALLEVLDLLNSCGALQQQHEAHKKHCQLHPNDAST